MIKTSFKYFDVHICQIMEYLKKMFTHRWVLSAYRNFLLIFTCCWLHRSQIKIPSPRLYLMNSCLKYQVISTSDFSHAFLLARSLSQLTPVSSRSHGSSLTLVSSGKLSPCMCPELKNSVLWELWSNYSSSIFELTKCSQWGVPFSS